MASSTQPYGKMLDYEQYIDHQLGRTRARIKMTDILTASLLLVATAVGVLFLEVVLDHFVGLPLWLRRMILVLGVGGGCAFAALRIAYPLIRRVNGFYAARTIEEADSSFKNSLINYLDLKRRGELSKAALAAIEAKAVNDLTQVEIDTVVNQRRLMQVAYTFSAIVVVFCLYAAVTPKSILDSTRRALLADVVRPTNTRLTGIKPGDDPQLSTVVAGSHVLFSVDVSQGVRPDRVRLHYSVDGGKFFSVQEFTPGTRRYDPWQTTLRNVQQSLDYYLTGGDAESLRYHLEVTPAPMVTSVELEYDFPRYLNLPRRVGIEGGNVEAIEGTVVTVHARTNEPARSANLSIPKASDPLHSMEVASSDPKELAGKFLVEKTGTYTIKFRTTGGQMNPDPVVYDIIALPDNPPTASFEKPERPEIEVPSNVRVPLVIKASDDHGVRDITLHVHQKAETLLSKNLLEQRPSTREFRGTEVLDLAPWKLKPGSELEYWLTVRDTKEPQSNRFETQRQKIKVAAPLPPAEKKAADERVQDEAKQEEQQSREAIAGDEQPAPEQLPPRDGKEPPDRAVNEQPEGREANPQSKQGTEKDTGTATDENQEGRENNPQRERPLTPEQKLRNLQRAIDMNKPNAQQDRQKGASGGSHSHGATQPGDPRQQNGPNGPREPVAEGNRPQPGRANEPSNAGPQPERSPQQQTGGQSPEVSRSNLDNKGRNDANTSPQDGNPPPARRDAASGTNAAQNRNNPAGAQNRPGPADANREQGQPPQAPQANGPAQPPGERPAPNAPTQDQAKTPPGRREGTNGPNGQQPQSPAERRGPPNPAGGPQNQSSNPDQSAGPQGPKGNEQGQPGNRADSQSPAGREPGARKEGTPPSGPQQPNPSPTGETNPRTGPTEAGPRSDQPKGEDGKDQDRKPGDGPGNNERNTDGSPRSQTPPDSSDGKGTAGNEGRTDKTAGNRRGGENQPPGAQDASQADDQNRARPNETPSGPNGKPETGSKPGASENRNQPGADGQTKGEAGDKDRQKPANGPNQERTSDSGKTQDQQNKAAGPQGKEGSQSASNAATKGEQSKAAGETQPKEGATGSPNQAGTPKAAQGQNAPTAGQQPPSNNAAKPNAADGSPKPETPGGPQSQPTPPGNQPDSARNQQPPRPGEPDRSQEQRPGANDPQQPSRNAPRNQQTPRQPQDASQRPDRPETKDDQRRPGERPESRPQGNPPAEKNERQGPEERAQERPNGTDPAGREAQRKEQAAQKGERQGPEERTQERPSGTESAKGQPQTKNEAGRETSQRAGTEKDNQDGKGPRGEETSTTKEGKPETPKGSDAQAKAKARSKAEQAKGRTPRSETAKAKTKAEAKTEKGEKPDEKKGPKYTIPKEEKKEPQKKAQPQRKEQPREEEPPPPPPEEQRAPESGSPPPASSNSAPQNDQQSQSRPSDGNQSNSPSSPSSKPIQGQKPPSSSSSSSSQSEQRTNEHKPGPGDTQSSSSSQGQKESPPSQSASQAPGAPKGASPGANKGQGSPGGQSQGEGQGQGTSSSAGNRPGGNSSTGPRPAGRDAAGQTTGEGQGPSRSAPGPQQRPAGRDSAQGQEPGDQPGQGPAGNPRPGDARGGRPDPSSGRPDGPDGGRQEGALNEQGTPSGRPDPSSGQQQSGGQQQPGEGRGGAGVTPNGGGGKGPGDTSRPAAPSNEDKPEPSPRAETPPVNSGETVAPDVPQSDLVLQKLEDLLKNNQVTPEMEKAAGMSREQMEQFVKSFKKPAAKPAGPGREIEVKPGKERAFNPERQLPELNPNARVGRTVRNRGSVAQDEVRDNYEGARFEIPAELRPGFDAYKSSISGARSTRPAAQGPASR